MHHSEGNSRTAQQWLLALEYGLPLGNTVAATGWSIDKLVGIVRVLFLLAPLPGVGQYGKKEGLIQCTIRAKNARMAFSWEIELPGGSPLP
jgi:hypothetical protein